MIGDKLQTLLDSKKIKAGTLASMTGISKSTIYSIIKRNNKNVDFSTMEKIADALNVPVEYFYDREPSAEKKEKPVPTEEDEQVSEIIALIGSLSDQKKVEAIRYLRYLSESEENE